MWHFELETVSSFNNYAIKKYEYDVGCELQTDHKEDYWALI